MFNAASSITRLAVLSVLAMGSIACARQAAPPAEAPALPPSIASVQQVMLGITIPASDIVWAVASTQPADDAAWVKVRANAAVLAESALMLLQAPRKADDGDWSKFTRAMYDAAIMAADAAAEKNIDKVSDAGNALYDACDGCHQKYMVARQGESSSGP